MSEIAQAMLGGGEVRTRSRSFDPASNVGGSSEWYTPPGIFDALGVEFDVDVASPLAGPVPWVPARRFIDPIQNGLLTSWAGLVWCNPPYGRDIERWTRRMIGHGVGLLLTFARTDTRWWQEAALAADAVCFVRGRIRFRPGVEQPPGRRSPTDRPGAANTLLAFGRAGADAVRSSGLGVVMSQKEPSTP